MNNNYFRKTITTQDQYIDIPIEINFDMLGREEGVVDFENEVISEIINPIADFEVTKFAHSEWEFNINVSTPFGQISISSGGTDINYEFYFFDYLTGVTGSSITNWGTDYENATFTDSEIYYFSNSFKGSFFKLDFYDTPQNESQKLLLSIILPTQQGLKEPGTIGPPLNQTNVQVKKPKFVLDSIGADKEGFYVYWLKDLNYLNITEFYVSAKFFNAKIGQFIRMINRPQSTLVGQNMFNIDKTQYFYYKYVVDYNTFDYMVYSYNSNFQNAQRVGTGISPIKWYEYVNP